MLVRTASEDDSEAIANVLKEAFTTFEKLYTPEAFDATILDNVRVRKRFAEKGRIWAALRNEKIVGTVSVKDEGKKLYIRSMAVLPVAQGLGTGQKLLEGVEDYASENGFEKLYLYTTPFLHGAIRLYEKNGFERLGNVDGFFGTPLIAMEKKLTK